MIDIVSFRNGPLYKHRSVVQYMFVNVSDACQRLSCWFVDLFEQIVKECMHALILRLFLKFRWKKFERGVA